MHMTANLHFADSRKYESNISHLQVLLLANRLAQCHLPGDTSHQILSMAHTDHPSWKVWDLIAKSGVHANGEATTVYDESYLNALHSAVINGNFCGV